MIIAYQETVTPTGGLWNYVVPLMCVVIFGGPFFLYIAWNQIVIKRNTAAAIAFGFILLTATLVLLHSCS